MYSRRAAKTAVGRTSRRRAGGRGWRGGDDYSDDDDGLARLRAGLGERGSGGGQGWDAGTGGSRGYPRESFSTRLPQPRQQRYGSPWEEDGSDG